jgi:hypothetical protein
MAGKQTAGSRPSLQSKCELVSMMAEGCLGVQRKKLITVIDLKSSDLQGSLIDASRHACFAAEAQYPSVQRPSVANHLLIREHTCLPYILGSH